MPPKPTDTYRKFMLSDKAKRQTKCTVCQNPTVAEIVVLHLDALREKTTAVSLAHVHRHLLLKYGAPKSCTAVYNHVNNCLGRNTTTGMPNDVDGKTTE